MDVRGARLATARESGSSAIALGAALTLTWLVLDSLVSPPLGALLGTGLVLTCVWLALTVRSGHFFVVGVLPPLLLLGVLLVAALLRPAGLEGDAVLDRVVGGLVGQRLALVLAWVGALVVLLVRSRLGPSSHPVTTARTRATS